MRPRQIPKKLLFLPLFLMFGLGFVLASRFAFESFQLFSISFLVSFVASVLVFFIVFKPVNLGTHHCLVYQRDGRLVNTRLQGGIALVRRFTDRAIEVDMRIQSISTDGMIAVTTDPVEVTLAYFLQWHVINPVSYTACPSSWKNDLKTIISTTIQNQINLVDVRTLLANRGSVASTIEFYLKSNPFLLVWGIRVIHFEITDLAIPKLVQDLLTREFVARFVTPAMVKEGKNVADAFAATQAIAGGDAALVQILKTLNETFRKK